MRYKNPAVIVNKNDIHVLEEEEYREFHNYDDQSINSHYLSRKLFRKSPYCVEIDFSKIHNPKFFDNFIYNYLLYYNKTSIFLLKVINASLENSYTLSKSVFLEEVEISPYFSDKKDEEDEDIDFFVKKINFTHGLHFLPFLNGDNLIVNLDKLAKCSFINKDINLIHFNKEIVTKYIIPYFIRISEVSIPEDLTNILDSFCEYHAIMGDASVIEVEFTDVYYDLVLSLS